MRVPSGDPSNRKRLLRRLRTGILIALLPVLALATWLYWLTLPEYELTGNEVYDAFAPALYEHAVNNLAFAKLWALEDHKASPKSFRNRSVNALKDMISFVINARKQLPFEKYESVFDDNVDYINMRGVFDPHQYKYDYLMRSFDRGVYDEGTFVLLSQWSGTPDNVSDSRNKAMELYPDSALWRFMEAERDLGYSCYAIGGNYQGYSSEGNSAITRGFELAHQSIVACLDAPVNNAPDCFPFSAAYRDFTSSKPRQNRRIAYSIISNYNYELDMRVNTYKSLLDAYDQGFIDYEFINDYLKYIYKWMLYRDTVASSRKQMQIKYYRNLYSALEAGVIELTDVQEKELQAFMDKLDSINTYCIQIRKPAFPGKTTDEKGWENYQSTLKVMNNYIVQEFSKLSPPTIEGWLAGGAKLKPRQNAGATQP